MSLWGAFIGALAAWMKKPYFSASVATAVTGYKKQEDPMPLDDRRREFIEAIAPYAQAVETMVGIPWLACVTQAAHESDFGRSGLSLKAHNLFGITGDSWKKQGLPVIEMGTHEYIDGKEIEMTRPFRFYNSYGESLLDWARLITFSYAKATVAARAGSVEGFFNELQRGGYATDPKYAAKLGAVYVAVQALAGGRTG